MGIHDLHGLEDKLWLAAEKLRGSIDASDYKHIVLGILFLKFISDSAEGCFVIPPEARFDSLSARVATTEIGRKLDNALHAIELANPMLKNVLPRIYSRGSLSGETLAELLGAFREVDLGGPGQGVRDLLGRVYEFFLARFAQAEGRRGGEFYTPACIVRVLVELLEPYRGRVYDPACGSGGMFIQSHKFLEAHRGDHADIQVFGQERNETTWRLCQMNLALHGIDSSQIRLGNSLLQDAHPGLEADFILANPPFNQGEWGAGNWYVRGLPDGAEPVAMPPDSNANFAWILHFISHLAPTGMAGFVIANGSLFVGGAEGEIRRQLVEQDLVDVIIAAPPQLFYTTVIPVCIWVMSRSKGPGRFRDRRDEVLFFDARKLFARVTRTQNDWTEDHIAQIVGTVRSWRGEEGYSPYEDQPGFCKAVRRKEIRANDYVLTPGRYVGAPEACGDEASLEVRMAEYARTLDRQLKADRELEERIRRNLRGLGYDL